MRLILILLTLTSLRMWWALRIDEQYSFEDEEFGKLMWGMVIDGKDATSGPHAYDKHGFQRVLESLDYVLKDTGNDDLTMSLIEDIHHRCCKGFSYRNSHMQPLADHGCDCFQSMECQARLDAIVTIPANFSSLRTDKSDCSLTCALPKKMIREEIQENFNIILDEYNEASKLAYHKGKKEKTLVLAKFLRQFAWLHPFKDGNGRFRTLMLQREIRHRNIARGAFMYNNNRDVFFITDEVYASKIEEGIQMASLALETNLNPWIDKEHVATHFNKFPTLKCFEGGVWGSVGLLKET